MAPLTSLPALAASLPATGVPATGVPAAGTPLSDATAAGGSRPAAMAIAGDPNTFALAVANQSAVSRMPATVMPVTPRALPMLGTFAGLAMPSPPDITRTPGVGRPPGVAADVPSTGVARPSGPASPGVAPELSGSFPAPLRIIAETAQSRVPAVAEALPVAPAVNEAAAAGVLVPAGNPARPVAAEAGLKPGRRATKTAEPVIAPAVTAPAVITPASIAPASIAPASMTAPSPTAPPNDAPLTASGTAPLPEPAPSVDAITTPGKAQLAPPAVLVAAASANPLIATADASPDRTAALAPATGPIPNVTVVHPPGPRIPANTSAAPLAPATPAPAPSMAVPARATGTAAADPHPTRASTQADGSAVLPAVALAEAGSVAAAPPALIAGAGLLIAPPPAAAFLPAPSGAPPDPVTTVVEAGRAPLPPSREPAGQGPAPLTIRLDPAALGSMQVRFHQPAGGPAEIDLTVERPETLSLLMRDQQALHRALDQAGFGIDSRIVRFHLGDAAAFQPAATPSQPATAPDLPSHGVAPNTLAFGNPSAGSDPRSGSQAGPQEPVRLPIPAWDASQAAPPRATRRASLARIDITA